MVRSRTFPYEWLIGLRYTKAGRRSSRSGYISFLSLVAAAGIALGVAALIVVLSVMNGFQKEVQHRMLSVVPHIELRSAAGPLGDWRSLAEEARQDRRVTGAAPRISGYKNGAAATAPISAPCRARSA